MMMMFSVTVALTVCAQAADQPTRQLYFPSNKDHEGDRLLTEESAESKEERRLGHNSYGSCKKYRKECYCDGYRRLEKAEEEETTPAPRALGGRRNCKCEYYCVDDYHRVLSDEAPAAPRLLEKTEEEDTGAASRELGGHNSYGSCKKYRKECYCDGYRRLEKAEEEETTPAPRALGGRRNCKCEYYCVDDYHRALSEESFWIHA